MEKCCKHQIFKMHFMINSRFIFLAMLAMLPFATSAQSYPSKPIKIVVAFGAGTATDSAARLIGAQISKATGQAVVVENRPGANGFLGAETVARAEPDGYTVLVSTQTTHAANPALFKSLPYDPIRGFIPVSPITRGAFFLVAAPSFPANNVRELIALAKKKPGEYTFGHSSSSARAGGELFRLLAKVDLRGVAYKTAPQVITDILGGHVDLTWADGVTAMPAVRAGKLKVLGVTSRAI